MRFYNPKDDPSFESVVQHHSAPEVEEGHEPTLQDELADAGVGTENMGEVMDVIGRHADRLASHAAAEILRRIAVLVSTRGVYGSALARVLGLAGEASLTELASCFAVSKQAIHQAECRLRVLLAPILPTELKPGATTEIKRPEEAGEWYTTHEAARLTGIRANVLAAAGKAGEVVCVIHYNTRFFREDSLLHWAEQREIQKASVEQQREAQRQGRDVTQPAGA